MACLKWYIAPPCLDRRGFSSKGSLTCPLLITDGEQAGFVGELWEQTAAFHDNGLWNHDDAGNQPDQNDTLAGSFGSTLELQGVADSVPAILGNAAQCQNRYRHRDCLEDNSERMESQKPQCGTIMARQRTYTYSK